MTALFTPQEGSLLVRLLLAHCLTDFFLQPAQWVRDKKAKGWASRSLFFHVLLTGLAAAVFSASLQLWWAVLILTITHYLIDGTKLQLERKGQNEALLFVADQAAHVLVIYAVWLTAISGWQRMHQLLQTWLPHYGLLLRLLGYLLVAGPYGYLIHFITRRWMPEINTADSLRDAGKWIGILERLLTLTFVYTSQFGAIGFLIAAKSILRVVDKPARHSGEPTLEQPFSPRKHTEYVLIGTFLSFFMAILTGLCINWLLGGSSEW